MGASAAARLVGGQTLCAIPIAMCTKAAPSVPNFGFSIGDWYTGRAAEGEHGFVGWVVYDKPGGDALGDILGGPGMCNIGPERVDAKHGVTTGVAQAWNTRFGLYAGSYNDPTRYPPDRTGWAFTMALSSAAMPAIIPAGPTRTVPARDGFSASTWPSLFCRCFAAERDGQVQAFGRCASMAQGVLAAALGEQGFEHGLAVEPERQEWRMRAGSLQRVRPVRLRGPGHRPTPAWTARRGQGALVARRPLCQGGGFAMELVLRPRMPSR